VKTYTLLLRHVKKQISRAAAAAAKVYSNEEKNRIAVNNSSFKEFIFFFPGKQKLRFSCDYCFRA